MPSQKFSNLTMGMSKRRLGAYTVFFSFLVLLFIIVNTNDFVMPSYYSRYCNPSLQKDLMIQEAMINVTRFLNNETNSKFITLSFNSCGGLANMIWRFASIYGIGRQLNRRPYIESRRSCWKNTMPEFYSSIPGLYNATNFIQPAWQWKANYGRDCCQYDDVKQLTKYDSHSYLKVTGNILQSYKYFHQYKPEIRALFEFSPSLKDYKRHIASILRSYKERLQNSSISVVLLGQDNDFLKKIKTPKELFYKKYKVENLNRAGEIHFGSTYCDSLLLTASGSTFGFWIAYLLPEERQNFIFYNYQASKNKTFGKDLYDFDSYPSEWNRLRLIAEDTIVYEHRWHQQINAEEQVGAANVVDQKATANQTLNGTSNQTAMLETKSEDKLQVES
ncbi:putative glycosyltransferase C06E1.7 [Aphelenchoides besseyi]|nr:putative glycosyltransferase C06E1.7 [Aphelenchoides besseyi]